MTNSQKGAALLGGALLVLIVATVLLLPPLSGDAGPEDVPASPLTGQADAPSVREPDGGPQNAGDFRPPDNPHMTLTIPDLEGVQAIPVPTAPGTEEGPLREGAMHVEGTGFPWQAGANVYIAGHRLGFPGTRSHRLFWDLDQLDTGDSVILEDAEGRRYEYAVFRQKIVGPQEISVAEPIPGKSVVSLQTCTLPDYEERLVVQAALVYGPEQASAARGPAG